MNCLQVLAWTALAIMILPSRGHFLYDEAYFYHYAMNLARNHFFTNYGLSISGTQPTVFTPGGGLWQILAPAFLFGTDPSLGTVWIILLSSFGILFFDQSLRKFIRARRKPDLMPGADEEGPLRFFSVFFLTWSAWHNWMSDRIWNVHFFWCLSLVLLSLVLNIISTETNAPSEKRPVPWRFFVLGLVSAFIPQLHIGGGLAILVSLFVLWRFARKQLTVQAVATYGLGVILVYLPYFYSELTNGFANTRGLHSAQSFRGWNRQAVVRSLFAPFIYVSHFKDPYQLADAFKAGIFDFLAWVSSFTTFAVVCVGLRQKHFFRSVFILSWILGPIYFLLNQRAYYDHYIASLIPYYLLMVGLGTSWLYRQGSWKRTIAVANCGLFFLLASLQSFGHYLIRSDRPTIQDQILATQNAVDRFHHNMPTLLDRNSHDNDNQIFVRWVLAQQLFGVNLRFQYVGSPQTCSMEIGPARSRNAIIVGPIAFLYCN